jgi:hypothetical protein
MTARIIYLEPNCTKAQVSSAVYDYWFRFIGRKGILPPYKDVIKLAIQIFGAYITNVSTRKAKLFLLRVAV